MSDYPDRIHVKIDLGMVGTGRWVTAGIENPFCEMPYLREAIHGQRMAEVISEREDARSKIAELQNLQIQHLEAVAVLAGAGNVSPTELVQLGVGRVVENPNWTQGDKPQDRYSFSAFDLDDLRDMNEAGMKQQATVAKFRQIKGHFLQHQKSVSYVLDYMTKIMSKNQITGQDRDQLQDLRQQLTELTGRKV